MNQLQILGILRNIQFLKNASDELLKSLSDISSLVQFPTMSVIFRQGDPARFVYFLIEGKVGLEICASGSGCKRILTVGPGDLLSWSPILQHEKLTATARALELTNAVQLDGEKLAAMGEKDPKLGYELMKHAAVALAKRLTATRMQLIDVYGTQMPAMPDERLLQNESSQLS